MKQFPILVVFCAVFVINVHAHNGIKRWYVNPIDALEKQTSHCHTDEYNIGDMNKSEIKDLVGTCGQAECAENRAIEVTTCGPLLLEPNCKAVPGDLSKPFPECCDQKVCGPRPRID